MQNTTKRIKRAINGVLLLNKPSGISSNTALQQVKRLFHAEKAGHTGSLDPLATGLLPICLGEATKFSQFLLDHDKAYHVVAKLGIRTDTFDAEGAIISQASVADYTLAELDQAFDAFRGESQQVPSMFSALKHQGQPLYKLARQGREVERPARPIRIDQLDVLSYEKHKHLLEFHVHCSKGTYIRSLVDDFGMQLGCAAHVVKLHRTAVGHFQAAQMHDLSLLKAHYKENDMTALDCYLLPITETVNHLPQLTLSDADTEAISQGKKITRDDYQTVSGIVALFTPNKNFIGIGEIVENNTLKPKRLMQFSSIWESVNMITIQN